MAKLVHGGRGGYCYEQNGLYLGMLQHIGFECTWLDGTGALGRPLPTTYTPRSHMMIHVTLPEGPYLTDAGFRRHDADGSVEVRGRYRPGNAT